MLEDLLEETTKVGLEVHLGKTSIMSNVMSEDELKRVKVRGDEVEVLVAGQTSMYLGRSFSLKDTDDTELRHRISRGWAKFGAYRSELTNKKYSLFARMRLFNAVVTPSVLYGCGSWTMTRSREQLLRSVQRKMMRSILGKGRKPKKRSVYDRS